MIEDLLILLYPWVKALHIMAVISWMAGLFYLPRLFVYHAETTKPGDATSETFKVMEEKLMRFIMQPAMITTWVCGLVLMLTPGIIDWASWFFWIKLLGVVAMTAFHEKLRRWIQIFATDGNDKPGRYYRMANEVPTVLMVVIVVMVVVRPF